MKKFEHDFKQQNLLVFGTDNELRDFLKTHIPNFADWKYGCDSVDHKDMLEFMDSEMVYYAYINDGSSYKDYQPHKSIIGLELYANGRRIEIAGWDIGEWYNANKESYSSDRWIKASDYLSLVDISADELLDVLNYM